MTRDEPIKVVVVDNHPLALLGISCALSRNGAYHMVGESGDANTVIALVDQISPDILIFDRQNIPGDVLGAIRHICKTKPATKTIVLSEDLGVEIIVESLINGAHAFILKRTSISELLFGVKSVLDGKIYVTDEYTLKCEEIETMVRRLTAGFSDRDIDILEHLMKGRTNKEIAHYIGRDINTVGHNLTALMTRLGVRNRLETAHVARQIWESRRL